MEDFVELIRKRSNALIELEFDRVVRRLFEIDTIIENDNIVVVVRIEVSPSRF